LHAARLVFNAKRRIACVKLGTTSSATGIPIAVAAIDLLAIYATRKKLYAKFSSVYIT